MAKRSSKDMDSSESSTKGDEKYLIDYLTACKREAEDARRTRDALTENNYDMYHLKHDFSHKKKGQSREILSKQTMAVDTLRYFFQQALTQAGDWWKVERADNIDAAGFLLIEPHEIQKLTQHKLMKDNYPSQVGNSVQTGALASLMITKWTGLLTPKPKYVSRSEGKGKNFKKKLVRQEDKTWDLKCRIVDPKFFFPDPVPGSNMYEIEEMHDDLFRVIAQSKGDDAIYDEEKVKELSRSITEPTMERYERNRKSGQDSTTQGHRPKVQLDEFWGTVIGPDGDILYENVVFTVANEKHLIRKPTPNPLWHQNSPYVVSPLIEVANSVWHRALMDAPTKHNRALIEIYNLMFDSAMKAVWGINQLRTDAIENPEALDFSEGISWGTTLNVNSSLPAGAKAMENVVTGDIPPEVFNIQNITQQEFNASAVTSDLRAGITPFREQKATAVVEQSQTITSILQGIAQNVEQKKIQKELELAWLTTAQNWDLISKEEFISLFGEERGEELSQLDPEDVFASTAEGIKFKVFGISQTLAKADDYRKLTTLLQTIGASEVLIENFLQKYDFGKMLGEIMTSLDIDKEKIRMDKPTPGEMAAAEQQQGGGQQPGAAPQGGPDQMSQVPQPAGPSIADIFGSGAFPQTGGEG